MKEIPLADVVAFYENYISPSSTGRSKLSVHVRSQKGGQADSTPEGQAVLEGNGLVVIANEEEVADVKNGWELSKGAVPVKRLEDFFATGVVRETRKEWEEKVEGTNAKL